VEYRQLGTSGPSSSKIAFGAMALTGIYGTIEERDALATLARVRELGITHIDTAEVYGSGGNERMVGRAIAGYRDEVLVATKFNFRQYRTDERPWPELVRGSIEGSLRRLGVDYVDIWYLHRVPIDRPIEETWEPMARAVDDGLVRYLGVSEASARTIRRAHAVHPITALQSEWSLLTREVESEILPTVRELGIGFVAYSPLSRTARRSHPAPRGPRAGRLATGGSPLPGRRSGRQLSYRRRPCARRRGPGHHAGPTRPRLAVCAG